MLRFVDNADLSDPEEDVRFCAEDQSWDEDTLKELRDKYNIIFKTSGDGVFPIMVTGSKNNPIFVMGSEDDGTIVFRRSYGQFENAFSSYWVEPLIADLKEAVAHSKCTRGW